jgi:8-oxo-dGTP pyrophosphatase MutT (NUDIX family)
VTVDPSPNPVPPEVWAALPRKRVGAGVVLVDDTGRVLLVEPTYKPGWEVPGGMAEAGEAPRAAARREVREELGLDVVVGLLLVVDWVPPGRRPDDGLMLLYAGEVDRSLPIVLQEDELRSWRWCGVSEVGERTTPFMARRLAAALAARADGATAELEDGYPVG